MNITIAEALWFLPFVVPICIWVAWSDLSTMRIPNKAVLALTVVFLVIGLIALPFADYPWRLMQFAIVLAITFIANAAGLMGAGDSKFIAAAAPFVASGDSIIVAIIFAANLLACFAAHRLAKYTGLRKLAPDWKSWDQGRKFPMGFSLAATLVIYLGRGAIYGA